MNGKNRVGKPARWNNKFIRGQIDKYQHEMLHSRFHWRAIRSKILMMSRLGLLDSLRIDSEGNNGKDMDSDNETIHSEGDAKKNIRKATT